MLIEDITFNNEQKEKVEQYLENEKAKKILTRLGVYDKDTSSEQNIESIKRYILDGLMGKYRGNISTDRFFKSMDFYIKNDDFKRFKEDDYIPDGFIDYNISLPTNEKFKGGLRTSNKVLGPDDNEYIVKEAERLKGDIAGKKYGKDGLYNPIIANAVFEFLGEEAAEYIPACEKLPYYYLYSKNFLKPNQKMYRLDDEDFMEYVFELDENGNIKHSKIMQGIEGTVRKKYGQELSEEQLTKICDKLKLQYASQETIKKLIKSMDENLGNTSIVITENDEGKMEEINISPAYDLDLSFLLGEELLSTDYSNQILYRTADNGKVDLKSVIDSFKEIPGYNEKINNYIEKFKGNYVDQIFDIASKTSGVVAFNKMSIKDKFGGFLMRQVALFKEACRNQNNKIKEI